VAARRDPQGLYAVAGTHRMPVLPGRVDVLLSHFSPVSAEDFRRIVKPGGAVLVKYSDSPLPLCLGHSRLPLVSWSTGLNGQIIYTERLSAMSPRPTRPRVFDKNWKPMTWFNWFIQDLLESHWSQAALAIPSGTRMARCPS
jgi:hypothetical protein